MECPSLQEQLDALTLNPEDEALAREVREHLKLCPVCSQEFADLREAWSLLPATLDPASVSIELEERVMRRIIDKPRPTDATSPRAVFWKYAMSIR